MGKIRELREAYVQGVLALKKCFFTTRPHGAEREVFGPVGGQPPRDSARPSEGAVTAFMGVLHYYKQAVVFERVIREALEAAYAVDFPAAQLRDLLNNPTETVELDDND